MGTFIFILFMVGIAVWALKPDVKGVKQRIREQATK